MKPSLRLTLASIQLSLLLLTMGSFGLGFYRNARATAEDLSTQILDQNAALIDAQINEMLHVAVEQARTNHRLLRSGTFAPDRRAELARYWLDVMAVYPRLTRLSLAMEATGDWLYVEHPRGGKTFIGDLRRDASTGRLGLSEYQPGDYPARPDFTDPDRPGEDPRRRPWYVKAKELRRPVWSETYLLLGTRGAPGIPGITYAIPWLAEDGSLIGVLGATFDVVKMSTFLRGLRVGNTGFAFIVECRDDGSRRVIAHEDPKRPVRPAKGRPGASAVPLEIAPVDAILDQRLTAFLDQVPAKIDPTRLRGTTRLTFEREGVRYLGAYSCLSTRETPDWLIGLVLPEGDVLARVVQGNRQTFAIGLGILLLAMVVSLYVSTQVARPLERIALETEAIGRFELASRPVAHSIVREVDRLAQEVEQTKTSLRSFSKYVPAELIRQFHTTGLEATLGGETRRMTVSFCDLADFTTLSERLSPEELVFHLGDYFGPLSRDIRATGGTVDKYIGDAIMAFWGAPSPRPDHAASACEAALRAQSSLEALRARWRTEGKPELHARIGIHTGEMIVGNIGSEARLNFTVIGDPVNVASRLEGLGKCYGASILIGDPTYQEARHAVIARPVDWVSVKGKSRGLLIHELLGRKDEVSPELEDLAGLAGEALALYRDREWPRAVAAFGRILELRPADGPARVLLGRCRGFVDEPPADDWDGVHRMTSK